MTRMELTALFTAYDHCLECSSGRRLHKLWLDGYSGIVPVKAMVDPGFSGGRQLPTGVHQPIILPKTALK